MLLYYYVNLIPRPSTIRCKISSMIHDQLSSTDMSAVLVDFSDVLLWMALSAGPFAAGPRRIWFARLLKTAQQLLCMYTFGEAVQVCEDFCWTSNVDSTALEFWTFAADASIARMDLTEIWSPQVPLTVAIPSDGAIGGPILQGGEEPTIPLASLLCFAEDDAP